MYVAGQKPSALAGANPADGITRRAASRAAGGSAITAGSAAHGQSGRALARTIRDIHRSPAP
jgi:hypothetical protein